MNWPTAVGYDHVAVTITRPGPPPQQWTFEIHLGVFVVGRSGSPHDCDLAVLTRSEGDRGRQSGDPDGGEGLVLGVESKHYDKQLPRRLGREYVGMNLEFAHSAHALSSNATGDDVHALIRFHSRGALFDDIAPDQRTEMELRGFIQHALRDFRE